MIEASQDKNADIAGRAAAAIVRMNPASLEAVRDALQQAGDENTLRQVYLYATLGYIGNKKDIEKLSSLLRDKHVSSVTINESLQLIIRTVDLHQHSKRQGAYTASMKDEYRFTGAGEEHAR